MLELQEEAERTRYRSRTVEQRFAQKVRIREDCWEWAGALSSSGYGAFAVNRRIVGASRFAWVLFVGPIPDGLFVCHHCDNRACVKWVDHLFLGTNSDNIKDAGNKKRLWNQQEDRRAGAAIARWRATRKAMGLSGSARGKLTLSQVQEIRRRADEGEKRSALAIEFGVHRGHLDKLAKGGSWK